MRSKIAFPCLRIRLLPVTMTSVGLSFAVHYLSFMISLAVITCDLSYIDLPVHHTYAGRFKYLTFISFVFDLFYYNMAAIIDFLVWARGKDSPLWRKVRDFLFTTVVFPVAFYVCVMFWAIYLLDPSGLRTPDEIKVIPWWSNHGYHTLPLLLIFLQTCLVEHDYPRKTTAFVSLFFVDGLYICWLFWMAYHANIWAYAFLARMSFLGVVLFVAASATITFALYFVGKKFADLAWAKDKTKAP